MPIIQDLNSFPNTRIIVWEIIETIESLKSGLDLSEISSEKLGKRKSEIHKKQFLAVRRIFKELLIDDQAVKYDKFGKPQSNSKQNISITHSGNFSAVIISDKKVGIDIEIISDKILKIKDKFLETELNYPIKNSREILLIYWNIKESIFKSLRTNEIDFRKNILVLPLNCKGNYTKSWYLNKDEIYSYDSYYKIHKNYTLAYVIQD